MDDAAREIKDRNAERRRATFETLQTEQNNGGWPDHENWGLVFKGYCDEQEEIRQATAAPDKLEQ